MCACVSHLSHSMHCVQVMVAQEVVRKSGHSVQPQEEQLRLDHTHTLAIHALSSPVYSGTWTTCTLCTYKCSLTGVSKWAQLLTYVYYNMCKLYIYTPHIHPQ